MAQLQKRSTELVEALVDEEMESGEFDIDSMRYAQMEQLSHGLGRELVIQVQVSLAARQGSRMSGSFACPRRGRDAPAEVKPKPILDDLIPATRRAVLKSARRTHRVSASHLA